MSFEENMSFEEKWDALLEEINQEKTFTDQEAFKHLIYDTFHYCKENYTEDAVPKKMLALYKTIAQVSILLDHEYLYDIRHSVQATFNEFCWGLCYVIEHGTHFGYYKLSLPTGLRSYTPAGCQEPEADMSSYESYMKEFNSTLEWQIVLREDEDEEWDEGEEGEEE